MPGVCFRAEGPAVAAELVGRQVPPRPTHRVPQLGERSRAGGRVEQENQTPTATFKVRGGVVFGVAAFARAPRHRRLRLADATQASERLAVAGPTHALSMTIVALEHHPRQQRAATRAVGATLVVFGHGSHAARARPEMAVRRVAIIPSGASGHGDRPAGLLAGTTARP